MEKIILASGSPRRKDILNMLGIPFDVIVSDADESVSEGTAPGEMVKELSLRKAEAVSKNLSGETIVIGSDTVVYLDNEILGKPKDAGDAYEMLEKLSGRTHIVYTGITVIFKSDSGEKAVSAVDATEVTFKKLAPGNISAYIASEEPFGKAGAYAVQGIGSIFIERINGDFFTV
ncbi:MAG: septum formation protein Maf, partial [Firmicutes bacterium]|nr:septum formation protein Maf [Bacillota bacterium]